MAKVTGPLMSIDARGKLADSLVFMGWKGINTVRQWVKPANPKTEKQQNVRAHFTDGVMYWHSLQPQDQTAWNARASGQKFSGFNMLVAAVAKTLGLGKYWVSMSNIRAEDITTTGFKVKGQIDGSAPVIVLVGTNPGQYTLSFIEAEVRGGPGNFTVPITGLSEGRKYYYRSRVMHSNETGQYVGETGEYTATTA